MRRLLISLAALFGSVIFAATAPAPASASAQLASAIASAQKIMITYPPHHVDAAQIRPVSLYARVVTVRLAGQLARAASGETTSVPVVSRGSAAPPAPATGYGTPPASFTACVIAAESGGDPTAYNSSSGASGLFGFLLSTWLNYEPGWPGGAYTAPVSVQYQAFDAAYAQDGSAPWSPYDGC